MKPNQTPEGERNLQQLLDQWTVDSSIPPRFQERVWQRIAQGETPVEEALSFWTLVERIVATNLPRPKFAYSYVAILVLVGVVSGAWAAQHQSNRLNTDLGSRYVQSVDPYHKGVE